MCKQHIKLAKCLIDKNKIVFNNLYKFLKMKLINLLITNKLFHLITNLKT